MSAAKIAQHIRFALIRQSRKNAHEIISLWPVFQTCLFGRQRFGIGFGLADFLRNGIGIVAEIDPRIIGGIGFRHFLGAVAQAHDAGGRALNQGFGLREKGLAEPF